MACEEKRKVVDKSQLDNWFVTTGQRMPNISSLQIFDPRRTAQIEANIRATIPDLITVAVLKIRDGAMGDARSDLRAVCRTHERISNILPA